jgi:sugar phosphate isomerase/epimerase
MKLTFSTLATPDWTAREIIDRAKAYGYAGIDWRGTSAGVDMTLQPEFTTDVTATRATLDSLGLQTPCVCSSVFLHTVDPARWNAMLEEFSRYLTLAEALDSPLVRVFPGQTPKDFTPEQTIDLSRRHMRQLLKLSANRRARPVLETHDDWNTGARLAPLLEAFGIDEFPVLWDVRHSFRAGEPLQTTIDLLGPRITHTHFKDDRDGQPTAIGAGNVPIADAVRLLRAIGYTGWYCLENEKRWNKSCVDAEIILPQYVEYMRAI